jgi:hemerythrin-like domain-containing protein
MRFDNEAAQTTRDIFELLRRDHRQVRGLLDEMEGTEDRDAVRRQDLFERLVTELEAHSQAEEDVFYSVLEKHADMAERIDEARQEHDDLDQMLEELDEISAGDAGWMDKIHELRQVFQRHIDEEEGDLFSRARERLGREETLRLAHEFVRARETARADVTGEQTAGEQTAGEQIAVGAEDMSQPAEIGGADMTGGEADMVSGGPDVTGGEADMAGGGPDRDDMEQMSKKELYELARQRQIEGRSAMTKSELVQAIRAAR